MKKIGLDQSFAWILSVIGAGVVFFVIYYFLSSYDPRKRDAVHHVKSEEHEKEHGKSHESKSEEHEANKEESPHKGEHSVDKEESSHKEEHETNKEEPSHKEEHH